MDTHTLTMRRLTDTLAGTLGGLWTPDDDLLCWTLEDPKPIYGLGGERRKSPGGTRIPKGVYLLRWRIEGKWANRFRRLGFPGSLQICDVPDYTDVLMHIGNTQRDTTGCILLGLGALVNPLRITRSTDACKLVYTHLMEPSLTAPLMIDIREIGTGVSS